MSDDYFQYLTDRALNAIGTRLNFYHNFRHNWWFDQVLLEKDGIDTSNPDHIDAQWETKFITLGRTFEEYSTNFIQATAYAKNRCFSEGRNLFQFYDSVKRWQTYFDKYGDSEEFWVNYRKATSWTERVLVRFVLWWYRRFHYSDFPF